MVTPQLIHLTSLRSKVMTFVIIIVLAGTFGIFTYGYRSVRTRAVRDAKMRSLSLSSLMAYHILRGYALSDSLALQGYISSIVRKNPNIIDMQIVDSKMKVMASRDETAVGHTSGDSAMVECLRANTPLSIVVTEGEWINRIVYPISSINPGSKPSGVLNVTFSLEDIHQFFRSSMRRDGGLLVLFGSLFALMLYLFMTRTIVNPVNRAANFASEIEGGRFGAKDLEEVKRDEIGKLAVTLNSMKRNLATMSRELIRSRDELKSYSEELEEKVKARTIELQNSIKKLEEVSNFKTDFISMLSHDVRNPLSAIKSSIQLLSGGAMGTLDDNQKKFLTLAERNVDRIHTMLSNLLDVNKIEAGKMEYTVAPVDVAELIRNITTSFTPLMEDKKITCTQVIDNGIPRVPADAQKIEQVLSNLLGNAIKFTGENGEIRIHLKSNRDESCIMVTVEDTGVGISEENLTKLFRKFKQGNGSSKIKARGTGLGLFLCREFVETHGGKIWADSTVNVGSMFHFTLPFDAPADTP